MKVKRKYQDFLQPKKTEPFHRYRFCFNHNLEQETITFNPLGQKNQQ